MTKAIHLGEMLIGKGLATETNINEALRIQVGGNRRLGHILVKMGIITGDQLVEVLAEQLDLGTVNPDDHFKVNTKSILPRYLCQKYTVLPLSFEEHNVLRMAMSDPSDEEAIGDIERFTGKVVKPELAHVQEIASAIKRYIPLSHKDFFNPLSSNQFTRLATGITLVLLVVIGFFSYSYIYHQKYGTISISGNITTYQNHDLILGVEPGKYSLFGHGAYAQGYYAASFDHLDHLRNFIEKSRKNFSNDQENWLEWVITIKLAGKS